MTFQQWNLFNNLFTKWYSRTYCTWSATTKHSFFSDAFWAIGNFYSRFELIQRKKGVTKKGMFGSVLRGISTYAEQSQEICSLWHQSSNFQFYIHQPIHDFDISDQGFMHHHERESQYKNLNQKMNVAPRKKPAAIKSKSQGRGLPPDATCWTFRHGRLKPAWLLRNQKLLNRCQIYWIKWTAK